MPAVFICQNEGMKKILIIAVAVIALAAIVWLVFIKKPVAPQVAVPGTANQPTQDLGTTLYNNASNPLAGKLPDTVAPVPNPIQGMYKNPF